MLREVVYTYHNDVNPDRLEEVAEGQEYSAIEGHEDIGSTNDLVQVRTRRRASGTDAWVTRYTQYRYYNNNDTDDSDDTVTLNPNGREHQVKCVIEPEAIQRMMEVSGLESPYEFLVMEDGRELEVDGPKLSDFWSRSFTYYTKLATEPNTEPNAVNTADVLTAWGT